MSKYERVTARLGVRANGPNHARHAAVTAPKNFTSLDARERNAAAVMSSLRHADLRPLNIRCDQAFGSTIFLRASDRKRALAALARLHKKGGLTVRLISKSKGNRKSWDVEHTSEILELNSDQLVAANVFHRFRIEKKVVPFCRAYSCGLRFVREEDGWLESVNTNKEIPATFSVLPSKVATLSFDGPIDLVYTWVDSGDPAWRRRKQAAALAHKQVRGDEPERYTNRNELKYSIRSVVNYMPWVRRIFIVTDRQIPRWLGASDYVKVVDHRDLFPDQSALPVFNSLAIESVLHRIEDLSETFIYLNDDFFINQPLESRAFVALNSIFNVFLSENRVPVGPVEGRRLSSEWGPMNASRMLERKFGRPIDFKLLHAPYVLRRSVMYDLESAFEDDFRTLRRSAFRSPADFSPIIATQYCSLWRGYAVPAKIDSVYVSLWDSDLSSKLRRLGPKSSALVFCVNDEKPPANADQLEIGRILKHRLSQLYPGKAHFER